MRKNFCQNAEALRKKDDMLIIRGVNVFPSQIESVLLSVGQSSPHYMIIVDRVNNTDTLEIQIEISHETFASDVVRHLEENERVIKSKPDSVLGLNAKVTFVEPRTLPRS